MRQALSWIYRWGWSSPTVIDDLGSTARRGLARRMVNSQLLRATRTESGGVLESVPNYILTLTELGLMEAERFHSTLLPYNLDPYRIDQAKIRHDLMAQTATLKNMKLGHITAFKTEREMAVASAADVKQPDALWILKNGDKVAVEIELTAKWERPLDDFVRKCVIALTPYKDTPARFNILAIITDSPSIVDRYKEAFSAGSSYSKWAKDERRHWGVIATYTIPEEVTKRILFRLHK